ncbi:DUF125-domain-containing protein [Epithele typhae]|uniref:DUF125-domain-containing protein n=1 Tax=Epithele typhae TaxID=378194 RepID=UPI002007F581|nr:DUF125-domain-containing protein [Epithele typhae]KAH9929094.1 DUF125-domain-containing protein [Epithele typhae]
MPESSSSSAPSVPLPRRGSSEHVPGNKPPVWSINNAEGPEVAPLPAKCDRHEPVRSGVCCKELKGDDERTLIDPDVVRDVVIGLSDGLTVPFALTAGLSSLGESKLVILGGIAELIAAERDHYRYLKRVTAARVVRSCDGEMEREVHAVLGPVGVDEKISRQFSTHGADGAHAHAGSSPAHKPRASTSSDVTLAEDGGALRWAGDVGLTAFLLKFGEGLEDPVAHIALIYSSVVTGIILLIFGAVKARITGAGAGFGDYVWGAISTLCVGGAAAAAAYAIVAALEAKE